MARAKRGFKRRRYAKKIRDRAEGFFLRRKNTYRRMVEAVDESLKRAQMGRIAKKRDFRGLWIARINAAARIHDLSYSRLVAALDKAAVKLNRKMLSEIAVHDPAAFKAIVDQVRSGAPAH
ncbi:MAG: 50S ribosomal protein L20 [Bdellovibrionales bacterium]|nr:50S ribosomal protein L20 [Bdellovibrionales bacterium]